MAQAPKDLFTAAMYAGSVRRYGDMVVLAMPSMGIVTTQQDMQQAQSWARCKPSSGIVNKDRIRLLERFETVIARQNSGCSTRGPSKTISGLVKIMASTGMVLDAWSIPKLVMDELYPARPLPETPKKCVADEPALPQPV